MKFEIVELKALSGPKMTFYTIKVDGEDGTLLEQFIRQNREQYGEEMRNIMHGIRVMSNKTGYREHFFKHEEGKLGDEVKALFDNPDRQLRLYCLRCSNAVIILGSGGPKNVRAWQDDPKLKLEAETMIDVAELVSERLISKEIRLSNFDRELEGNLTF